MVKASEGDPKDPEIARILSELPIEIINYYNYYTTVRNLQGADFVKAMALGVSPDIKLLCSKNTGLVYFIKGLTSFVKAMNATGSLLIKFNTQGIKKPIKNPWIAFTRFEGVKIGITTF